MFAIRRLGTNNTRRLFSLSNIRSSSSFVGATAAAGVVHLRATYSQSINSGLNSGHSYTSQRLFSSTVVHREGETAEKIEPDSVHGPESLIVEIDSMEKFREHVNENSPALILDFYADWCGPCKKLSPILEQLVLQFKGRFKLLKINVDNVQDVASQFNVSVLPTLYGVIGGTQIAAVETGLHPEEHLREWIKAIINAHDRYVMEVRGTVEKHIGEDGESLEGIDTTNMSPHERLDLAARLMAGGKHEASSKIYTEVIEDDTAEALHPKAYAGLLMCLIGRSQFDDCEALIESIQEKYPVQLRSDPELLRSVALVDLGKTFTQLKGDSAAEVESSVTQELENNPDDISIRHKHAIALFMIGKQEAAITAALEALKKNPSNKDTKELLIKFFNVLGPQSKLTLDGRRRMASYLF